MKDGAERLLDPQGQQIDDPNDIPALTLKEARALISQDALTGCINLDQSLEVQDQAGRVIHALLFKDAVQIVE